MTSCFSWQVFCGTSLSATVLISISKKSTFLFRRSTIRENKIGKMNPLEPPPWKKYYAPYVTNRFMISKLLEGRGLLNIYITQVGAGGGVLNVTMGYMGVRGVQRAQ